MGQEMKWAGNCRCVKKLKAFRISLAFKTLFEIVFICLTLFNLRSYAQILCLFLKASHTILLQKTRLHPQNHNFGAFEDGFNIPLGH